MTKTTKNKNKTFQCFEEFRSQLGLFTAMIPVMTMTIKVEQLMVKTMHRAIGAMIAGRKSRALSLSLPVSLVCKQNTD